MTELAYQARGELERIHALKVRRPPKGVAKRGGEYDWYFALPAGQRSRISRDFMADAPDGLTPDHVATILMAESVDDAMEYWLSVIRLSRAYSEISEDDLWGPAPAYDDAVSVTDLVGPLEVAERLGVKVTTVHQWRFRGVIPQPTVVVSNTPIWAWAELEHWALETGRLCA